jgi:hypothetical protein
MAFNRNRVVELVTEFYRSNEAADGTEFVVALNLEHGLRMAALNRPAGRWASIPVVAVAGAAREASQHRGVVAGIHDHVFSHVSGRPVSGPRASFDAGLVISADFASDLPAPLRRACRHGLGWLLPANRKAVIVPTPVVRLAEGRPDVIHDDTGRIAIVWPDSHGYYFLPGSEFDKRLYFQIINHDLLIQDIAALDNADHRAIALQYLTFEQLALDSDAELVDQGGAFVCGP